jgi:uncharacterized membrane protein YfhO
VPGARVAALPRKSPGEFAVDVESPIPGFLFVSEKYFPGWTATVNGEAVEIHRANVTFRAVRVPAGRSRVEFIYRPWTVRLGGVSALLALLVGGGALLRRRRAERTRPE